jgi:cytochrome c biogenesis protein CcdA
MSPRNYSLSKRGVFAQMQKFAFAIGCAYRSYPVNKPPLQSPSDGCDRRGIKVVTGWSSNVLSTEIGVALLGTGLGLGLRHGIDWDHIAAIADVTSSQKSQRRSLGMGTLYALGHAAVVIVLGLLAIWFGTLLPDWVDGYMEFVVGITLLALGAWLIWSMSKNKGRLVMRSRWMLVYDFAKSSYRKIARKSAETHDSPHSRERSEYGSGASVSIGVIHGIGAETGSQALLLAAAAGATSALTGSFLLIAFVVGLVVSNTIIAIASTAGLLGTDRHRKFHMVLGVVIAVFSLALGAMFVLGMGDALPSILA